ncbi:Actin- protein 6 [Coemansia erecta]|uniref:Actin-like protein ARP6 n=1 Tax=Coemansia erecta TaxID=147472 RepID=A0A9W8CSZ8_9FUNG|nr:Actin- protein 6 [Coemansia erecta]
MDEIVFEEYCFRSLIRAPAPKFSALNAGYTIYGNANPECVVVVDIGHTCTYVVPYHQGQMIPQCVRRVDVGGRMLTSYLKETVSFRYWDMMDETYIINAVKEKCCFVSQDFYRDLEIARKGRQSMLGVDYVLPDFTNSKKGFIRGQEPDVESRMSDIQILPLCNERFAVPEALFHPMDVGLDQGGIHLAVVQAIMACEERLRPVMFSNIILVGGSSQLPGLQERLQTEIQALAPADGAAVVVTLPDDPPAENAWLGARAVDIRESQDTDGSAVAASGVVDAPAGWRISREAYQENGPDRTISHFKRFI